MRGSKSVSVISRGTSNKVRSRDDQRPTRALSGTHRDTPDLFISQSHRKLNDPRGKPLDEEPQVLGVAGSCPLTSVHNDGG